MALWGRRVVVKAGSSTFFDAADNGAGDLVLLGDNLSSLEGMTGDDGSP